MSGGYQEYAFAGKELIKSDSIGEGQIELRHLSPGLFQQIQKIVTHTHHGGDSVQLDYQALRDRTLKALKSIYGFTRSRQGGSSTNWSTTGTTTYDVSAVDTYTQCGVIAVNANPTTITFPTAYTYTPVVVACTFGAASANVFTIVLTSTTTNFTLRQVNDSGVATTTEKAFWIAIGQ